MAKRYQSVLQMVQQTGEPQFAKRMGKHLQERTVSKALFVLRNREKLTQAELAERMGCPQSRVSKLEHATNDSLRVGDLEQYLTHLGYSLELRVVRKNRAVDRIKCSVFEIKAQLDRLARLAQEDAQIRRGVGRFFSEYMANVVVLFADSVRQLGGKGRLRTERQYEIVGKVFDSTMKLLEDSGSLTPVAESVSEPGITICTPVEAEESEAPDPVPVPPGSAIQRGCPRVTG